MKSRLKQLGRDSVIYGVGGILAKSIAFLLLPVFTRVFTPAEYGTIEMLTVLSSFLSALLMMGMDSAQTFYFYEQKGGGQPAQARIVTAILQWRLTWGAAITAVAMLLTPLLNAAFFDGELTWVHFAVAFVGVLFGQLMMQSAEVFRLLYRPWKYIGVTLTQSILSAGAAIALVVWLHWGALGYFTGFGVGSMVAALIGWWNAREYLDWSRLHQSWWPRLLRFGAPLVPTALAMYVLNTSDRWFIVHYHGQDAVGLYAVGAKFAILIALAVATFRRAWWPILMDAMHSPDGPELSRTVARLYLSLGAAGVVVLTAISPLLVQWFTTPPYYGAYPIIGILAWHSIFFGFYLIAAGGIWKRERTRWAPIGAGIAALVNVGLDAWLVPRFGGIGAAIATSISFLAWIMLTLLISERLWPVRHPVGVFGLQIGIGFASTAAILILHDSGRETWKIVGVATLAIIILASLSMEPARLKTLPRLIRNR